MTDLDRLAKDDFDPHVGDRFELELSDGRLGLELVSTQDLASDVVDGSQRAPFSLLFRSPGEERHVEQRIHTLRHAELGTLEIFLVPLGPDGEGMCYEAVFS